MIRRVRVPVCCFRKWSRSGRMRSRDRVRHRARHRFGAIRYPEVKIGFVPAMVMAIYAPHVSEKRASS